MIVVDASVAVKWFVEEQGHAAAIRASEGSDLAGPDRLLLEIANVLRRKVKQREVTANQAAVAVSRLPELIDTIVPSASLLNPAFALAERLDHSVYDCAYLACALHLDIRLLTADGRFAGKARLAGFRSSILDLAEHSTS